MRSQDKNLPYEILTLSHLGFKYCSVQHLIEMTSNIIFIVALGVGFKCPHKIHLNTQCPPDFQTFLRSWYALGARRLGKIYPCAYYFFHLLLIIALIKYKKVSPDIGYHSCFLFLFTSFVEYVGDLRRITLFLKFIYSEKTTKFCEIFNLLLTGTT